MADNVNITPGTGDVVAADDIGGVKFQRVKQTLGPDGTANDAVAGAGPVGVGVQRVTLASDDPAVTQIGALTEAAPGTDTASSGLNGRLQRLAQRITTLIANIGSSADTVLTTGNAGSIASYLRTIMEQSLSAVASVINVTQVGGNAIATGNGVVGTGVQRVAIASDNTAFPVNATSTPAASAHALIPAPSTYRLLSALASTNGANIKGSAGTVKGIQGFNNKASAVFLKLYNKATSPTVGTDTPVKTLYLPASAAFAFDFGTGVAFTTGIGIALTGAGADADATALVAGDIVALNVDYH